MRSVQGWALIALLLVVKAIGAVPTAAMPSFLGYYESGLGFSLALAGRIASLETMGIPIGQAICILFIARRGVNLRIAITIALGVFAIAQLLSLWPQNMTLFSAGRMLSGIAGGGLIEAIVCLYFAGLARPDRAFSLFYGVFFVVGPLGLYGFPPVFEEHGVRVVYLALFVVALAAMVAVRWLPSTTHSSSAHAPSMHAAEGSAEAGALPVRPMIAGLLCLSLLVNYIGNGGVWVYMERIGSAIGMDSADNALYLSVGMVTGLLGSAAAVAGAGRMGRSTAILIGLAILAASYLMLLGRVPGIGFLVAVMLLNVAVTFLTPFYLSALSRTDRTGRNATLGVFSMGIGYGLGPGAMSLFLGQGNFHAMLLAALGTAVLSALLLAPTMVSERRNLLANARIVRS